MVSPKEVQAKNTLDNFVGEAIEIIWTWGRKGYARQTENTPNKEGVFRQRQIMKLTLGEKSYEYK